MQTFLPFADFRHSAEVLDSKRLGKQIIEARQIYRTLNRTTGGWRNHPAVRMWRGHQPALVMYTERMNNEWHDRYGRDHRAFINLIDIDVNGQVRADSIVGVVMPEWLGDDRLHGSHRAALLAKKPEHYEQFGWVDEAKLDYWWPV